MRALLLWSVVYVRRCNLALYYGVGVPQELVIGMKYRLSRGFAAGSRATSNVPLIDSMPPASKGTGGTRREREHCYANGISMTSYRSRRRYGKRSGPRGFFHFEGFICNRLCKDRWYFLDVWCIILQDRFLLLRRLAPRSIKML